MRMRQTTICGQTHFTFFTLMCLICSRQSRILCFRTADIKLSVNGNTVSLTLGSTSECYGLQKVGDNTSLAASLFSIAKRCAEMEERLAEAERTVESLKRSAASGANTPASIFDMSVDSKKKKMQPRLPPKQAGMSIVNPGSRKRAKAKGVEFEWLYCTYDWVYRSTDRITSSV